MRIVLSLFILSLCVFTLVKAQENANGNKKEGNEANNNSNGQQQQQEAQSQQQGQQQGQQQDNNNGGNNGVNNGGNGGNNQINNNGGNNQGNNNGGNNGVNNGVNNGGNNQGNNSSNGGNNNGGNNNGQENNQNNNNQNSNNQNNNQNNQATPAATPKPTTVAPGGDSKTTTTTIPPTGSMKPTTVAPGGDSKTTTTTIPPTGSPKPTTVAPGGDSKTTTTTIPPKPSKVAPGGDSKTTTTTIPPKPSTVAPGGDSKTTTTTIPPKPTTVAPGGEVKPSTPAPTGGVAAGTSKPTTAVPKKDDDDNKDDDDDGGNADANKEKYDIKGLKAHFISNTTLDVEIEVPSACKVKCSYFQASQTESSLTEDSFEGVTQFKVEQAGTGKTTITFTKINDYRYTQVGCYAFTDKANGFKLVTFEMRNTVTIETLPKNAKTLNVLPVNLKCTEHVTGYCLPSLANTLTLNDLKSKGTAFDCSSTAQLSFTITPCKDYFIYCFGTNANDNTPSQVTGDSRLRSCDYVPPAKGYSKAEMILYVVVISVIIMGGIIAYKQMFMQGDDQSFLRSIEEEENQPFNQTSVGQSNLNTYNPPPPPSNINLPRKQQTVINIDGEKRPMRKAKAKKPVVDENADYFAELGMESNPVSKKSRRGK